MSKKIAKKGRRRKISKSRRSLLQRMVKQHGPTRVIKKLRKLMRTNPDQVNDIVADAAWIAQNVTPQADKDIDAVITQKPRRRSNPTGKVWGPKLFDPFEDDHPFEKNPKDVTRILSRNPIDPGGLFSSPFNRRHLKNPNDDVGGLFSSLYT